MKPPNWMLCSKCGVGHAESHVLDATFAGPQTVYTCSNALCEECSALPFTQDDINRSRGCRTCMGFLRQRNPI